MSEKTQLTTFNKIIEVVIKHEGGYVNDPNDLGGETKYGITKRFYPDVDIKNLTKNKPKQYIIKIIGDQLNVIKFHHV